MSFLKTVGGIAAAPILAPYKAVARLKTISTFAASRTKERIGLRVTNAQNRKENQLNAELLEKISADKSSLMQMWGVTDDQYSKVISGLKFEFILYAFCAFMPAAVLFTDVKSILGWINFACLTPICAMISSTKYWRYQCLVTGKFIPYKKWILN